MLAGINVVNAKYQEAILRLWEAAREAGGRNRSAAEAGSPKLVKQSAGAAARERVVNKGTRVETSAEQSDRSRN